MDILSRVLFFFATLIPAFGASDQSIVVEQPPVNPFAYVTVFDGHNVCPESGAWPAGCIPRCPDSGPWPMGCAVAGDDDEAGQPCPESGVWPQGCIPPQSNPPTAVPPTDVPPAPDPTAEPPSEQDVFGTQLLEAAEQAKILIEQLGGVLDRSGFGSSIDCDAFNEIYNAMIALPTFLETYPDGNVVPQFQDAYDIYIEAVQHVFETNQSISELCADGGTQSASPLNYGIARTGINTALDKLIPLVEVLNDLVTIVPTPVPDPTDTPMPVATDEPIPTVEPTMTVEPTDEAMPTPTEESPTTAEPTATPMPTNEPMPTAAPTDAPTAMPTNAPTAVPTNAPTNVPPTAIPTNTPMPTATSIPPTDTPMPEPGRVEITFIFYDGEEFRSEGDEYAEITNLGGMPINIGGYRLYADDKGQNFPFPDHTMQPGDKCRIYTDRRNNGFCNFSYNRGSAIWNNDGDCGQLYDAADVLIDEYCY